MDTPLTDALFRALDGYMEGGDPDTDGQLAGEALWNFIEIGIKDFEGPSREALERVLRDVIEGAANPAR